MLALIVAEMVLMTTAVSQSVKAGSSGTTALLRVIQSETDEAVVD